MKNRRLLIVLFMIHILYKGVLTAQIHYVPQDFVSIQEAINAAVKGDTILVDTGRYYENINFKGKSIVVASKYLITSDTSYIRNTIIDGGQPVSKDTGSCVLLISSEDSTTLLEGFTLTNGTGTPIQGYIEGGGVLMDKSSAVIRNNIITDNKVAAGGGGIAAWNGDPSILNNVIINNQGAYAAGVVLNWSGGTVRNNIIYHNSKTGSQWLTGGLMVWDEGPAPQIVENNTIVGNISFTTSGGMSIDQGTKPVVRNNIIWGNLQKYGSQITGTTNVDITYCNIEDTLQGEGNISSFPLFQPNSLVLEPGSPCIDAGDSAVVFNDLENGEEAGNALFPSLGTLRNDIGAYGGPNAMIMNTFDVNDLYVDENLVFSNVEIGSTVNAFIRIVDLGTSNVFIDSITHTNPALELKNMEGDSLLRQFDRRSVEVLWTPDTESTITDTVKIFHTSPHIANPKITVITGRTKVSSQTALPSAKTVQQDILNFYPNPCIATGTIHINLSPGDNYITLNLYDVSGSMIKCLYQGPLQDKEQDIPFNCGNLPKGHYIIKLITREKTATMKIFIDQ